MTVSATNTSGTISSAGIGSGIDVTSLVTKLMSAEQGTLTKIQSSQSSYQAELSAFGTVSGGLSGFETSLGSLLTPTTFTSQTAASSDSSIATVALSAGAGSGLSKGNHTLAVTQLAQVQSVAASGVSDVTSAVGTGSLTIRFGTYSADKTGFTPNTTSGAQTIAIDAAHQSLTGIRDAINQAGAGVTASIVNDGSGNRLVMTGNTGGAANGFQITSSSSTGSLAAFNYDPTTGGTSSAASLTNSQDAVFSLDGLTISKPTNLVSDAVANTSFTLSKIGTTTLTVAADTSTPTSALKTFVNAYNTLHASLSSLTAYDPTSNTAGPLNGDPTVSIIQQRLSNLVAGASPTTGRYSTLADVGISLEKDGTLTLDQSKLGTALATDATAVYAVFGSFGAATDSLVSYGSASSATQSGSYGLQVSSLASTGSAAGSTAAGLTITAGVNDALHVTVNGNAADVTLTPGTYANAAALATELQARINGSAALFGAGAQVTVTQNNGILSVTSTQFGSTSTVSFGASSATTSLFGTVSSQAGTDVTGTLGGNAFTGLGQALTGGTGSGAEGLTLTVAGGATGARGAVNFSVGLAAQLKSVIDQYVDSSSGIITAVTDGINTSLKGLASDTVAENARLDSIKQRYTDEFNTMDSLVASMNATSSYLTTQLAAIATTRTQIANS